MSLLGMTFASKSVVTELNKDLKLNVDNYNIWSLKIQSVLEELDALQPLNMVMEEPEDGQTMQHWHDRNAYLAWKRKNSTARIILLSAMNDDITRQFRIHLNARDLWVALREKFGRVSLTKLRPLMIRFDSYVKQPKHTMKEYLCEMSNMIRELQDAGHQLTDEQKVQVVIRSLPSSWKHMKDYLSQDENVKTFDDIARHLVIEENHLAVMKFSVDAQVAPSSSNNNIKRKDFEDGGKEQVGNNKQPKIELKGFNKKKRKVNVAKVKCYNCQQKGHYAKDCTVERNAHSSN